MRRLLHHWLFTLSTLVAVNGADIIRQSEPDLLRDFPEIYTMQTAGLKADERLARAYNLLAARLKVSVETVVKKLPEEAKNQAGDPAAAVLKRAFAQFALREFVESQKLALEAGDAAHRSVPRRSSDILAALRLAAFSAMEQEHWAVAIKFLSVATGETDIRQDLRSWSQLQVGIAHCQQHIGLLTDQERTLKSIFSENEHLLGPEHAETLHYQNELAATLYENGKDAEAEQQLRLILRATLKTQGSDHADTQSTRKNLARVLEAQKKFSDASAFRRDVVMSQTQLIGAGATTTLKSRQQWVQNLLQQGKYEDAASQSLSLAEDAERSFSRDAPITLQARIDHVFALVSLEKSDQALPLARAVHADCLRVFGSDHADTQKAQLNLARCLNQLKQPSAALALLTELLDLQKRTLLADDEALVDTHYQMSISYLGQEKLRESLDHLRVAITYFEGKLGKEHPKSQAVNGTANTLINTDAGKRILIDERRAALAKTTAKLGSSHPQTLAERSVMAQFISGLGLAEEALKEQQQVHSISAKKLGANDLQTLDSLRILALAEMDLRRFAESEAHLRELLGKRQRLLPPEDPAIHESRYHLGLCLGRSGKLKEASELVSQSYEAVKDRAELNAGFVAQMKSVLAQLTELQTPGSALAALSASAPFTVQKAPTLQSTQVTNASEQEATTLNINAAALPHASTLVPTDSIQKHIQVNPQLRVQP